MPHRLASLGLLAALAACDARPSRPPAAPPPAAPPPAAPPPAAPPPAAPPPAAPPPANDDASISSPTPAPATTQPEASPTPAELAEPASAEPLAGAALLGRSRADVEEALGRPRGEASGWVDHGALAVRYRDGRCVGLRRQVPKDMDCQAAVESLGFRPSGFPLRRADGCEWPGISERHRIAPGIAGRYDIATQRIEVWRRD